MKRTLGFLVALLLPVFVIVGCGTSPAPTRPSTPSSIASIAEPAPAQVAPAVVPWSCVVQSASFRGILAGGFVEAGCPVRVSAQSRLFANAAPTSPMNLTSTVSGGTVTLTWSAGAGDPATSYVIEAGSSAGSTNIAVFDTLNTSTSFTASGVPAGSYFVRVRARNSAGTSSASNEVVVIVGGGACTTAPGAPSGLTGSVSGSSVTLNWTGPAGGCAPTGYVIVAGSSSGSSDLAHFNTGSTATTFSAGGVPNGPYFVRVRAANSNGLSDASNEITVVVGGPAVATLTGRWIGLVANGDGLTESTRERRDLRFDLTQSGTTVTGTYTQTDVLVEQNGVVRPCAPNCETNTIPLSGTADSGSLSLSAMTDRGSLILTGTYTASRMTGSIRATYNSVTATFALNKQ